MGGFMAGAGVLIAHLGLEVMPARLRGTTLVMCLAGALTLGLMSYFVLHSDFRWLLVVPPILWAAGVVGSTHALKPDSGCEPYESAARMAAELHGP
jgi:hypothetical protein